MHRGRSQSRVPTGVAPNQGRLARSWATGVGLPLFAPLLLPFRKWASCWGLGLLQTSMRPHKGFPRRCSLVLLPHLRGILASLTAPFWSNLYFSEDYPGIGAHV